MMRFQIRDLEGFSGVKAHTIRIWEKRYGLLQPDRSGTNIRYYGSDDLRSLLNVAYLNQRGFKISKIAALSVVERETLVREVAAKDGGADEVLNMLKLAMLGFDEALFNAESAKHVAKHGFRSLMEDVYARLLEHIGLLWQTSSICPAQEHFVSNIIRQKLIVACDALPMHAPSSDALHVLYLPENEIHELGLLYLNYVLRSKGKRTVYLGQSVPSADLSQLAALHAQPIVFVTLLTSQPPPAEVHQFLTDLRASLPDDRFSFWLAGAHLSLVAPQEAPAGMRLYTRLRELIVAIDRA